MLRRDKARWDNEGFCRAYTHQQNVPYEVEQMTYILQLRTLLRSLLALRLSPQHYGINQGLRLLARNVSECRYELVKSRVDSRSAHELYASLWLATICHALVDLLLGLADEGVEEVVEGIFADRLELVGVLVMARLGAVVVVSLARRPGAGSPLRLPLKHVAITVCCADSRMGPGVGSIGGKGVRYGFLGHDRSIEGSGGGDNGLGAQRARGRGVDEAGVARVLDAVDNGRVAVVGVGAGGLALEGAHGAVGARIAAHCSDGRRLGARRDGAGRGRQGPAAGLAGFAGGRRGVVYMVRHIPSSLSGLQERERGCTGARKGQPKDSLWCSRRQTAP